MQKLIIKIESKDGNFGDSLQIIQSQIDKGFFQGFDKNSDENYEFNIK